MGDSTDLGQATEGPTMPPVRRTYQVTWQGFMQPRSVYLHDEVFDHLASAIHQAEDILMAVLPLSVEVTCVETGEVVWTGGATAEDEDIADWRAEQREQDRAEFRGSPCLP